MIEILTMKQKEKEKSKANLIVHLLELILMLQILTYMN